LIKKIYKAVKVSLIN